MPLPAENECRVKDRQGNRRDDDHGALEDHERNLFVCDGPREALRELGDTVDGSDENGEGGDADSWKEKSQRSASYKEGLGEFLQLTPQKASPFGGVAKLEERGICDSFSLADAPGEICARDGKKDDTCDLPREACNHDVDAHLCLVFVVACCCSCDAAPCTLQHESNEVADHEDERVCPGLKAGIAFAVCDDDAGEAQVDGGAEESGRDGQADDVDEERVEREGVAARHEPADIACHFQPETEEHADQDAPCSAEDAEGCAHEEDDAEDNDIKPSAS